MAEPTTEWDVALSFAGEQRAYVQKVADRLRALGIKVFYDAYLQEDLWGKDLYAHLDRVYRTASHYCVLFISADYARKVWTNHERRSAQARALESKSEYILPARFDDTDIPGLLPTTAYIDLAGVTPDGLAEMISRRILGSRHVVPPSGVRATVDQLSGRRIGQLVLPPVDEAAKPALTEKAESFIASIGALTPNSPEMYRQLENVDSMADAEFRTEPQFNLMERPATDPIFNVLREMEITLQDASAPPRFFRRSAALPEGLPSHLRSCAQSLRNRADELAATSVKLALKRDELWTRLGHLNSYLFVCDELARVVQRDDEAAEDASRRYLYGALLTPRVKARREEIATLADGMSREYLSVVEAKNATDKLARRLHHTVELVMQLTNALSRDANISAMQRMLARLDQDKGELYALRSLRNDAFTDQLD